MYGYHECSKHIMYRYHECSSISCMGTIFKTLSKFVEVFTVKKMHMFKNEPFFFVVVGGRLTSNMLRY